MFGIIALFPLPAAHIIFFTRAPSNAIPRVLHEPCGNPGWRGEHFCANMNIFVHDSLLMRVHTGAGTPGRSMFPDECERGHPSGTRWLRNMFYYNRAAKSGPEMAHHDKEALPLTFEATAWYS